MEEGGGVGVEFVHLFKEVNSLSDNLPGKKYLRFFCVKNDLHH